MQEIWQKFNANERLVGIGAIVILIAWIVGIVSPYGIGASTISLLGALAVLAIYYLKYAPNQNINWPAPIPTLVLGISAVVALLAVLTALQWLGVGLGFYGGLGIVAILGQAVGAVIMVWGAWQEYQAQPKTAPPAPPTPPTPPA